MAVDSKDLVEDNMQKKVCVTGTFTLENLKDSFLFWKDMLGINIEIVLAPFQQVFQQLLLSNSEVRTNNSGFNLVVLSLQDWIGEGMATEKTANLIDSVKRFSDAMEIALSSTKVPYQVFVCPSNIEVVNDPEIFDLIHNQEQYLSLWAEDRHGVQIVLPGTIEAEFAIEDCFNKQSFELAHIPYSSVYYSALMTKAFRLYHAETATPYKVVVLDCDNTLWRGQCAEVGPLGVGISREFAYLQSFFLKLKEKGYLLCLCSSNDAEDVWATFSRNPDMILKREHIVTARINWEPKWKNINSIAEELNLGIDSMIFVDDDSFQCAQMRKYCPSVLTFQVPKEAEYIPLTLQNSWFFDLRYNGHIMEDRTSLYQQQRERDIFLAQYENAAIDFLDALELEIDIKKIEYEDIPRVVELMLRTNQFNFTGKVMSEAEIVQGLGREFFGLTALLKDRFGSYGLIAAILYRIDDDAINVINMVLSCRAFGRGVEHGILSKLAQIGIQFNVKKIIIHSLKLSRNKPALEFLSVISNTMKLNEPSPANDGYTTYRFSSKKVLTLSYREILKKEGTVKVPTIDLPQKQDSKSTKKKKLFTVEQYFKISDLLRDFPKLNTIIHASSNKRVQSTIMTDSTANGKKTEFITTDTETEKMLLKAWEEVLDLKGIQIHDNVFHLGADSLRVVEFLTKIHMDLQRRGISLSVSEVAVNPSISQLSAHLDAKASSSSQNGNDNFIDHYKKEIAANEALYQDAICGAGYKNAKVKLDLKIRHDTSRICTEDSYATVLGYLGFEWENVVTEMWSFKYIPRSQYPHIPFGLRFSVDRPDMQILVYKHFGVKLSFVNETSFKMFQLAREELLAMRPCMVIIDNFWNEYSEKYLKFHTTHSLLITGLDEERKVLLCLDPYNSVKDYEVPLSMFFKCVREVQTFTIHNSVTKDFDWKRTLRMTIQRLYKNKVFDQMRRMAEDISGMNPGEVFEQYFQMGDGSDLHLRFDDLWRSRLQIAQYLARTAQRENNALLESLYKRLLNVAYSWWSLKTVGIRIVNRALTPSEGLLKYQTAISQIANTEERIVEDTKAFLLSNDEKSSNMVNLTPETPIQNLSPYFVDLQKHRNAIAFGSFDLTAATAQTNGSRGFIPSADFIENQNWYIDKTLFSFPELGKQQPDHVASANQHILASSDNISEVIVVGFSLYYCVVEVIKFNLKNSTTLDKTICFPSYNFVKGSDTEGDNIEGSIAWNGRAYSCDLNWEIDGFFSEKFAEDTGTLFYTRLKFDTRVSIDSITLPDNPLLRIFAITLLR